MFVPGDSHFNSFNPKEILASLQSGKRWYCVDVNDKTSYDEVWEAETAQAALEEHYNAWEEGTFPCEAWDSIQAGSTPKHWDVNELTVEGLECYIEGLE